MTIIREAPPVRREVGSGIARLTIRVGIPGTIETKELTFDEYRTLLDSYSREDLSSLCIANAKMLQTLFWSQEGYHGEVVRLKALLAKYERAEKRRRAAKRAKKVKKVKR